LRNPNDAQSDGPYTVDNASAAAFTTVPGLPESDYAAALTLDQSGSVNSTDPTGARLFSAKAFVDSVDAASGDSVLLSAFADDNNTQTALIPTKPLTVYGAFTNDGASYFDELDTLRDQSAGGTPLYRSLFPEPDDPNADPAFTTGDGLIDIAGTTAPASLNKAIVLFTDGEDSECGGPNVCRLKRQRVIDHANAADIEIFRKVHRTTARYFFESMTHWLRFAGYAGVVIVLDVRRVMVARNPRDGSQYYTKAAVLDTYEVLRQFIDAIDRLDGCFITVILERSFFEDLGRGIGAYEALKFRIFDEIRDRSLVNPMASLARISDTGNQS
jgi:hypothetical protein